VLTRLRSKLTYANVMSTIAVFCVLTGVGFAVAKLKVPKNSVGAKQLKTNAVHSKKISKNAVNASKIASGAVGRSEIAGGAVGSGEISNSSVTTSKIANGAVTKAKIDGNSLPLISTLSTGQTLRGSFDVGSTPGATGNDTRQGYSFQFPLLNTPTAPATNVLDLVATPTGTTASCSGITGGNQQTPNAAGGQLCIYITGKTNLSGTPVTLANVSRLGFGLTANSGAGTGAYEATGFWAVTAP
jgi:hypothetical protein